MHRIERTFAGRRLVLETGRMARQAHGSCLVQFGETVVLCTATVHDTPTTLPFFPLTVEYRERSYAAGKIPGGFIKREGRPSEKEILSARQIDRPIRPLFPDGFMHEVQIFVYVLSADQENDADVLGLLGTSVALNASKIPFTGPVAAVRVGRIQGQWVLNPTFQQLEFSDVDIVVAGTENAITMVEGGAIEVPEEEIAEALLVAHRGIRELIEIQRELLAEISVPKMEWTPVVVPDAVKQRVEELALERIREALNLREKSERNQALATIREEVKAALEPEFPEDLLAVDTVLGEIEKQVMRRQIVEKGERADGRRPNEIRPITCEVGVLPRTHGSALFTRGQTQALAVVTLGTSSDEQRIDTIDVAHETSKSFMLHYNFPPFATGEVKPVRGLSRREIGHGALAERAIQPLLPPYEEFPYTIRVVSDILESNGSSSMASVCGASLALMDAGAPVRAACAGVAMGLIKEGDDVVILTDILGLEDALGDMDFKVAGTRTGVTSIQMDIKIEGLTIEIMRQALEQARVARMHILDIMDQTLPAPRPELSRYAPRIFTMQINPDKIGEVIGPKGKTIRSIQDETGTEITVDDTGLVTIASVSAEGGERAREMIAAIVQEPEIGRIYEGVVKATTSFGAFVEILPGVEGLVHISELQEGRTERTEDVLKKGDVTRVKLLSIDEKGRMRLSRKAAL
ncbi:MAG TPA: polyribonucleotide nucleotidyltransferase [Longimicrobiales bacterium]|nr:polyribonucleotide nucleotidyltransferase [Longimicrobiales bacterium]